MSIIYVWVLFVIVCLLVIIPAFGSISIINDNRKDGSAIYLMVFSLAISGLIPLVGETLIKLSYLVIAWKVIISIIWLMTLLFLLFNIRRSPHYIIGFTLSSAISVTLLLLDGFSNLTNFEEIQQLVQKDLPTSITAFWIPLFIIVTLAMLLVYEIVPAKKSAQQTVGNRYEFSNSVASTLIKMELENFSDSITKQHNETITKLSKLQTSISQLKINNIIESTASTGIDNRTLDDLAERFEASIALLTSRLGAIKVNQLTISNQLLVRELNHFIATPLATIETSCDLLIDLFNPKGKNKEKAQEKIDRIKASVEICKGILMSYKEIFLSSPSEVNIDLKDLIKNAFEVYKDKKPLKINIQLPKEFDGVPNYMVISTIMPILANAVKASKENTTMEVRESHGSIIISNTFTGEIDIENFYIDGYSTKENHYGMGLFTVRHLLASRKLGCYNVSLNNNRIIFEIPIK